MFDFKVPYERLLRDQDAVMTLSKLFLNFELQKDKIVDMCSKSNLLKDSYININKTLTLFEIKEFKKLILTIISVRRKLGLNFNPNFVDEILSSMSFNYERLFLMISISIIIKFVLKKV